MVGKLARFLAPIALAAVAVGVYLIIHSTVVPRTAAGTNTSSVIVNNHRQPAAHHKAHRTPKFYVVKSGDTLSAISGKTGVSVSQLSTLNPSLANAPNSLQTGQRLRLRH